MKLKLLLLTVLGSVAMANAQFTVKDGEGNVLHDGDVLEFATYGYNNNANYDFYVTNDNPSETIYTRIEFVDAVNATGEFFELCYALQCYNNLSIGQTVPPAPEVFPIAVGETTGEGNHFLNVDPGNGVDVLDYVFTFHQYEADGVTEIGTPLTFTYRYNPTLGVSENNTVDLTLQSTVVSNEMVLNVNEPIQMLIYNMQGKVVKQGQFEAGRQTVNVSNLSPQTYIVQFKNQKGAVQTDKIIIQ